MIVHLTAWSRMPSEVLQMITRTATHLLPFWMLAVACVAACTDMDEHAWLVVKNETSSGVQKLTLSASDMKVSLETLDPGQSALLQMDQQLWSLATKSIQVSVQFVDGSGESREDVITIPTQPGAVGEIQASLRDGGRVNWQRSLKSP